MLSLILCAQFVIAARSAEDSTYSSAALRNIISAAARENRRPPPALQSYRSHIETEMSLMIRDTLGRERTAEVEQLATAAHWNRNGTYDLHVVGYRSQNIGVPYSTLSFIKGWTVPTLYGERLSLGAYAPQSRRSADTTLRVVHPFSEDRDPFYRFTGGDTVTVLRAGTRIIPIVRVRVTPHFVGPTRLGAFDGEIDLDADRAQIVRMRGRFVMVGGTSAASTRISRGLGVIAVAYIEFVNAEVQGKYWLPAFQRTELQASMAILGQSRPVVRLVSNISAISLNESDLPADSTPDATRVRVTWARGDSIDAFSAWQREIGTQTAAVRADDFDDIGPDAWRPNGAPRLNFFPNSTNRILRFNRVEGLFTGVSPSVDFRNVLPGLSVGAHAGWAWSEQTARAGGFASYRRGALTYGIRAERTLASTNDFSLPLSDDPGLGAMLSSIDDNDYVDRRNAMASATKSLGGADASLITLQVGIESDRAETARLSHGLVRGPNPFRQNRGVSSGNYGIAVADFELHPNVTGDFVQPGVGGHAHYEVASGELDWQRAEVGVAVRRYWGRVSLAAHVDAGLVAGRAPPPQTLFEVGGNVAIPGYDYKAFAGDRAALFRTFASYRFAALERPMRVWRNIVIPGLSPGVAVTTQGAWTEISSLTAARSVRLLGAASNGTPVSMGTGGIRSSVGGGMTLLGDLFHVGVARPVDHRAPWKFVAGFGVGF
jgi:hypothetical protein